MSTGHADAQRGHHVSFEAEIRELTVISVDSLVTPTLISSAAWPLHEWDPFTLAPKKAIFMKIIEASKHAPVSIYLASALWCSTALQYVLQYPRGASAA